jgi:xylulokinase
MAALGDVRRVVAVGGGAQGNLWTQIVSDITGREQQIPKLTIGAALGSAWLAANAVGEADIAAWNPIVEVRSPDPAPAPLYASRYEAYRELYQRTADIAHRLAAEQTR